MIPNVHPSPPQRDSFPAPSAYSPRSTNKPTQISNESDEFYSTKLNNHEKVWCDRYTFLLQKGYQLRPRYRPGWTASWIGTSVDPSYCEDSIEQILPMVLDAKRRRDGLAVCVKRAHRKSDEAEIGRYLSSEHLREDTNNHCVPTWDNFRDPLLPDVHYIVMPILRPFDDPEFGAVGEIVDFISQILEGTEFMHRHRVAHGDLTGANLMMDGHPIIPHGWHFVADNCSLDGINELVPLARIDHPVRYFIIDFDSSVHFRPGQSSLVTDLVGRDDEVPEFHLGQPYDAFKVDVFTFGNLLYKEFYQKYLGLGFMKSLVDLMMIPDFRQRPTAQGALHHWYQIRAHLEVNIARWRLRKRDETVSERMVLDTVAVARRSLHNVSRLFKGDSRPTWSNP